MPTFDTVYDAFCYTLAGILLALITMRVRRDLRAGSLQSIILLLVGLVLLWALYTFGGRLQPTLATALGETLLFVITLGFARVASAFVFQTLLRKRDIPRILAQVSFVVVLIGYAIWRLHAAGVNPTSLGISAAAIGRRRRQPHERQSWKRRLDGFAAAADFHDERAVRIEIARRVVQDVSHRVESIDAARERH